RIHWEFQQHFVALGSNSTGIRGVMSERGHWERRLPAYRGVSRGNKRGIQEDWSGRRDSNPRRPAWKAGTHIFTARKQRIPFNSVLLTAVHYTAENTAVAKSFWDLLPWHVLIL